MPRKEKPKIGFSSIILFWYLGVAMVRSRNRGGNQLDP